MEAVILAIVEFVQMYWAYIAMLLPVVAGGIGLLLQGRLRGEAHRVIAAVYRAAIREAREFGATGLVWLVSPEGVAFRKDLAERAYDALPPRIGAFPVGVIKAFVSRDRFVELVELSFAEVVELADKLEDSLPAELEPAA